VECFTSGRFLCSESHHKIYFYQDSIWNLLRKEIESEQSLSNQMSDLSHCIPFGYPSASHFSRVLEKEIELVVSRQSQVGSDHQLSFHVGVHVFTCWYSQHVTVIFLKAWTIFIVNSWWEGRIGGSNSPWGSSALPIRIFPSSPRILPLSGVKFIQH
jgi:hypothetical protein